MAQQITAVMSDFHQLWKNYLCSVYKDNPNEVRRSALNLVSAILAHFQTGNSVLSNGFLDMKVRDIIIKAISDAMAQFTDHFFAWDHVLLLEEVDVDSPRTYSLYKINPCGVASGENKRCSYHVCYADGAKLSANDSITESVADSYLFTVADNGKSVESRVGEQLSSFKLGIHKVKADNVTLKYQRLLGGVWYTTDFVEVERQLTICPIEDGISSWQVDDSSANVLKAAITVSHNEVTIDGKHSIVTCQRLIVSGSVVITDGENKVSLSDTERVVLLRPGSFYWKIGSSDNNRYEVPAQKLFGNDSVFLDIFNGSNDEDWYATLKGMEHCPCINEDFEPQIINLGLNKFKVSLVPGIYMVKSPNRKVVDWERMIGEAWYKDESVILVRNKINSIQPDDSGLASIRIGEGKKVLLNSIVQIDHNNDHLLKYNENLIDKADRVEIQGPAIVYAVVDSRKKELTLSQDERIVFHSTSEPRLQVIKGMSVGDQFNSYLYKIIHNRLRNALQQAAAIRARINIDFLDLSEEQIDSDVKSSSSTIPTESQEKKVKSSPATDAYFISNQVPFEIPTDLGRIDALNDFHVALLYCMNSKENGISDEARCFLKWHSILATSEDGKGDHIMKDVQEHLPDNHPDKDKLEHYSKLHSLYNKALIKSLKKNFNGIFDEYTIDGKKFLTCSRSLSPNVKQKIEEIRQKWREDAENTLSNGSNKP